MQPDPSDPSGAYEAEFDAALAAELADLERRGLVARVVVDDHDVRWNLTPAGEAALLRSFVARIAA